VFSSRVNVGKENSRTAESERERFSKWADIGNEWVKMHHQRVEILKVGEQERTFAGVESAQVSKNAERKKYRVSRCYLQKYIYRIVKENQ